MKNYLSIVSVFIAGVACTTAFMLSCSGTSAKSDAADGGSCSCPTAEPPIVATRFVRVTSPPITLAVTGGQQVGSPAAVCPAGSQLISGDCNPASPTLPAITLQEFGSEGGANAWTCVYKNNSTQPVDVVASALCLKLAP
jgi:hypothetical protein